MFKVVPDQLRISDGWVRCGHCDEIFDASSHLQPQEGISFQADATPVAGIPAFHASEPQSSVSLAPSAVAEVAACTPHAAAGADETGMAASPVSKSISEWAGSLADPSLAMEDFSVEEGAFAQGAMTDALVQSGHDASLSPGTEVDVLLDVQPDVLLEDLDSQEAGAGVSVANADQLTQRVISDVAEMPVSLSSLLASGTSDQAVVGDGVAEPAAALSSGPEPSFVREARRKVFWRGRWVRGVLWLLALTLLVVLLMQAVVSQRDRMAAAEPRLKPGLEWLCAQLGCSISALRQIEAIAIESSSFNKLDGDTFRLSFMLRNSASLEVATPSLELTLTDTQDQPVLRRVIPPSELGAPASLVAGGEWSGVTTMKVDAGGGSTRIAGYRLIAFYP
jgi:predicted Zn finger-like uncharacterized protein